MIHNTFTKPTGDTETIVVKTLSDGSIKPSTALGVGLQKVLQNRSGFISIAVESKGSYLKQYKATFTHRNVVNLFIVYEIGTWSRDLSTKFTLGDCLFGAVMLTRMLILTNKYRYSGYGVGFNSHSYFSVNCE